MKTITPYALVAAFIAIIFAGISYCLTDDPMKTQFLANLLLNIVAEFVGISLGLIIVTLVAKKKLKETAPDVVRLILLLRKNGNIKPEVARAAVVAFVSLIDEEAVPRGNKSCPNSMAQCTVCDQASDTHEKSGSKKCNHCGLPGEVWQLGKN